MVALALAFGGCMNERDPSATASQAPSQAAAEPSSAGAERAASARKVVRRAELSVEVTALAPAELEVTRIVERHAGYVAEAQRATRSEQAQAGGASASFVLRVPEARLTQVLVDLRRLSAGDVSEHLSSEDVTEEAIDLEARIANERHLERQLVELLKGTTNVEAALKVHQELVRVRTEIDRHEGRRRFLEKESALATIQLSLSTVRPLVSASWGTFRVNALHAVSDAIGVGSAVVIGSIRLAGVLLPFLILAAGPLAAFAAWNARRKRRARAALAV